jgi:hypothetical protein
VFLHVSFATEGEGKESEKKMRKIEKGRRGLYLICMVNTSTVFNQ